MEPICDLAAPPLTLVEGRENRLQYTYSVSWIESDVSRGIILQHSILNELPTFPPDQKPWATRWDSYLKLTGTRVHWFSLINSTIICMFLCVVSWERFYTGHSNVSIQMVVMVLLRTVSKDVHRYNAIDLSDDVQEDFGWKLVHAEVFRQPRRHMLLAIFTGSGAQLASMMGVAIFFALLGFLSPSNRGSLSTVMIVCWTLFGGKRRET